MRVLIATLLLVTTLVVAGNLAASYMALSRVASVLPDAGDHAPQRIAVAQPQAARPLAVPLVRDTDVVAVDSDPAPIPDEDEGAGSRGARAMQAAAAADPEIAGLLEDRDPKVRNAMRAFFEDTPTPAAAADQATRP